MGLLEKRKYPRKAINLIVDYRSQNICQYKAASNISWGGLFIQTTETDSAGAKANLVLHFPQDEQAYEAKGRVVWVRRIDQRQPGGKIYPAGIGLELLELSELTKKKIQGFLEV